LYALQSSGLDHGINADDGVEAMARRYVDRIRTVQPTGPYHLLGWSFGGLVAHEMAAMLQRDGEDVALLALLDAYPAVASGGSATFDSLGLPPSDLAALGSDYVDRLTRVFAANVRARALHRPSVFDGALLFFESAEGQEGKPEPEAWHPFVTGAIDSHRLRCAHVEMAQPTAMAQIGPVVAARLAQPPLSPKTPERCGS
jgi:thioesterase domain-containing protein